MHTFHSPNHPAPCTSTQDEPPDTREREREKTAPGPRPDSVQPGRRSAAEDSCLVGDAHGRSEPARSTVRRSATCESAPFGRAVLHQAKTHRAVLAPCGSSGSNGGSKDCSLTISTAPLPPMSWPHRPGDSTLCKNSMAGGPDHQNLFHSGRGFGSMNHGSGMYHEDPPRTLPSHFHP